MIDSGLVELLDDEEEMRFLLGHELGHALSGHAVYQTLLRRLIALTGVLYAVPGGAIGVRAITAALMEWSRKAELSADRAGLLATQNPAAATRVHMKLASGGHLADLDATSFFAQGNEYSETEDFRDSVLKVFLVENQSHPFAVVRAAELRRWTESGEYTAILGGSYPRREDDATAPVSDCRAGGRGQLRRDVPAHPGRAGQPDARGRGLDGAGPDVARRAVPPAATSGRVTRLDG